ncbi:hypothetical protein ACC718_38980, partial [Rhizobium ruizarguesonis]
LAWAWNIDLIALSASDTPPVRVAHGIISAVSIRDRWPRRSPDRIDADNEEPQSQRICDNLAGFE